jgi:hypothetical protein
MCHESLPLRCELNTHTEPREALVCQQPIRESQLAHLVELGQLSDPTLAVDAVVQRAEFRGLGWEIAALRLALAPVRALRN